MKTNRPVIQKLIDYLENMICDDRQVHTFKKVGPRTFFYKDDIDTIFVKVNDENLITITDGDAVVDGIEMTRLIISDDANDATFNYFLQKILHLF